MASYGHTTLQCWYPLLRRASATLEELSLCRIYVDWDSPSLSTSLGALPKVQKLAMDEWLVRRTPQISKALTDFSQSFPALSHLSLPVGIDMSPHIHSETDEATAWPLRTILSNLEPHRTTLQLGFVSLSPRVDPSPYTRNVKRLILPSIMGGRDLSFYPPCLEMLVLDIIERRNVPPLCTFLARGDWQTQLKTLIIGTVLVSNKDEWEELSTACGVRGIRFLHGRVIMWAPLVGGGVLREELAPRVL